MGLMPSPTDTLSTLPSTSDAVVGTPEALVAWTNTPALLAFAAIAMLVAASFALGVLSRLPRATRHRRIAALLALLAFAAAHGFGWLALDAARHRGAQARLQASNDVMVGDALAYLARRCDSDRRMTAASDAAPLFPNQGVLLDIVPLHPPTADDLPPVEWFDAPTARQVLAASQFGFVEQDLRMTSRGAISVTAHRLWWESAGRTLLPPANADEFVARLAQTDLLQLIEGPVRTSTARYLLSVQDASTPEDRSHWVARVQLQLFDRRRGALVAEYIGFGANLLPAYRPRHGFAWRSVRLCDGPEQEFSKGGTGFDVTSFFLRRAVRVAKERPKLMT
jgi:hypothetical protein